MTIYFTADYHLGHTNIIKYCNRPFKDVEEMDRVIILNHNTIVKKDDILFHIGDFCWHDKFEEYRKKLNGNIIFISGNHDDLANNYPYIERLYLYIQGLHIHLVHDPEYYDIGMLNLVGHIHQLWVYKRFKLYNQIVELINVGVDRWMFMPVSFLEILDLRKNIIKQLDKKTIGYEE